MSMCDLLHLFTMSHRARSTPHSHCSLSRSKTVIIALYSRPHSTPTPASVSLSFGRAEPPGRMPRTRLRHHADSIRFQLIRSHFLFEMESVIGRSLSNCLSLSVLQIPWRCGSMWVAGHLRNPIACCEHLCGYQQVMHRLKGLLRARHMLNSAEITLMKCFQLPLPLFTPKPILPRVEKPLESERRSRRRTRGAGKEPKLPTSVGHRS